MFGPDVSASVTPTELRQLIEGIRFIEKMKSTPVGKDALAAEMQPLRDLFTKSIVARVNLSAGTVLQEEHLALKKPGTGIPAASLREVIGRRLHCDVQANQMLQQSDLSA
jgi:N,N'-diacetyllegionaminate synthase